MMGQQMALEAARGMMDNGMSADDANVEVVRMRGFVLVTKLPASVRKAYNNAVKAGKLGHIKKEHLKPEAFFHPNSKANAISARNEQAFRSCERLASVCC